MMSEFITIGEPMAVLASQDIDVPLKDVNHFDKFLAGAELNVAVGVSRLNHTVSYVSSVGNDPFGSYIISEIKNSNIDSKYLTVDDKNKTGFYLKQKVSHGDPEIYYYRKNSAASNYDGSQLESIDFNDVKIAHLSGIFAALSRGNLETFVNLNKRLNNNGILTTFDPNLRPALWQSKNEMIKITNQLAQHGKIVMPGINEGEILMGSRDPERIADFYLDQGIETEFVVVKVGSQGAFIKGKNGITKDVPGFKVDKVVDTVGAGDGFAVGLISGLLEGLDIADAAMRGNAIGALAVQSPGDNDGYPTKKELNEFILKYGDR